MHAYRAYVVDPDDRILKRIDLICEHDDDAKERAKQLERGHAVELWDMRRKIATFQPRH